MEITVFESVMPCSSIFYSEDEGILHGITYQDTVTLYSLCSKTSPLLICMMCTTGL
jgi:hypothetical protein